MKYSLIAVMLLLVISASSCQRKMLELPENNTETLSETENQTILPEEDKSAVSTILPDTESMLIENIIYHADRGGEEDLLEQFYKDDNYLYSFPSIRSDVVIVYYKDGTEKPIREALADGTVKIHDLDRFGIKYYREPAENSASTIIYSETEPGNQIPINVDSDENVLVMKQYRWDGWGIDTKTIRGSAAGILTDMLLNCEKNGETAEELSDTPEFDEHAWDPPYEKGTMWIETDGRIYRMAPRFETAALVEWYLGAGEYLTLDERCRNEINQAWRYWPRDSWQGTYEDGILTMNHVYRADSAVSAVVSEISIDRNQEQNNSIKIEFTAEKDMALDVRLDCQESDDCLGTGDHVSLDLKSGEAQTEELSFSGFSDNRYYVYIEADNTWIEIKIIP